MTFSRLPYAKRANFCTAPLAARLLHLLDDKKTNLALSADLTTSEEILAIAKKLGPYISVLKTHVDFISDFSPTFLKELHKIAQQFEFLIFEDRKFADIGNTVKLQYRGGIYQIAQWADIINAHILPGPGIIQGLNEAKSDINRGLLLIAEMSSAGNLMDESYAQKTLHFATQYADFVIGFISQRALSSDPRWIYFTPGIGLTKAQDGLGQQYISPEKAILENGTDILIVGRGILNAQDPIKAAQQYQEKAWLSYTQRCNSSE